MTPEAVVALLGRVGVAAAIEPTPAPAGVACSCEPERLPEVLRLLRDQGRLSLLSSITALDEEEHFRLLYHLVAPDDPELRGFVRVEVRAPRGDHPDGPLVPSAVSLYPGANLQEREIFDLMGIRFAGHPRLRRVLTWPGFRGHPLRKDYEPIDEEIPWRLAGLRGPDGSLLDDEEARWAAWETDEWEPAPLDGGRGSAGGDLTSGPIEAPAATGDPSGGRAGPHPEAATGPPPTQVLRPRRPAALAAADAEGRVRGELVRLHFGPHHPSTHGVLHLLLTLEGETVVDCEVVFGYLHRAIEKLAEQRTYVGGQALCDRLDYVSAMTNNHAWTLCVERLLDIEPPPRVQLVRTMMDELSRMASHWIGTGVYGQDVGVLVTSVMWAFNWREEILDVFEDWCGQRMTFNFYRPGTVYPPRLPDDYQTKIRAICDKLPDRVEQVHRFLTRNGIFQERTSGIGVLSAADAVAHGVTGPTLRGSGVAYDVRKVRPYAAYADLDFDVVTRPEGDCMARYLVRLEEMLQSRRIILQCLERLPHTPPDMGREPKQVKPPAGREAYVEVEGPKGAVGCYMKASGGPNPERMKWRSPSFINLGAFPLMCRGGKIADLVSIFGSIDINMGEVDR